MILAAFLLPLGLWSCTHTARPTPVGDGHTAGLSEAAISALALLVGVVGSGIYGIGGGSILGPILVGRGVPVVQAAPGRSGVDLREPPQLVAAGRIAPDWPIGVA